MGWISNVARLCTPPRRPRPGHPARDSAVQGWRSRTIRRSELVATTCPLNRTLSTSGPELFSTVPAEGGRPSKVEENENGTAGSVNSLIPGRRAGEELEPEAGAAEREVPGLEAGRLAGRESRVGRILDDVGDDAAEIRAGQGRDVAEDVASQERVGAEEQAARERQDRDRGSDLRIPVDRDGADPEQVIDQDRRPSGVEGCIGQQGDVLDGGARQERCPRDDGRGQSPGDAVTATMRKTARPNRDEHRVIESTPQGEAHERAGEINLSRSRTAGTPARGPGTRFRVSIVPHQP